MSLKELILKIVLKRRAEKMLDNVMSKVNGYKTYVAGGLGIVVAVVGCYLGPIDLGFTQIPHIESADMWKYVWSALMALFMRHGIANKG
jgi:hypothetical protein